MQKINALRVGTTALSLLFPAIVFAQAAAPAAPASPHTFTGNVALVSDYKYRSISQTFRLPAVQGGFDYSHTSGFYLGTWASNISGNQFPNGASMEWDFYGGYKGSFGGDVGFDVGFLKYYYPGTKFRTAAGDVKADTDEIYFALSYKWLSAKYSHSLSDLFGTNEKTFAGVGTIPATRNSNSKGSGYLDITGTFDLGDDWSVVAHVGHQKVKGYGELSYTDWKIGVNKVVNGFNIGLAYIDNNADALYYTYAESQSATSTKDVSKGSLVLSVSKTF